MVRAAASGAFDYTHADPYSRQWRLRHLMVLREVARKADSELLVSAHAHWLAYVTHSSLDADSWDNCKKQAAEAMQSIQGTIFPWVKSEEKESKTDTISNKYDNLIASYRRMIASKSAQTPPDTGDK